MKNLQQVVEYNALKYPKKIAIHFLSRGEEETEKITYQELLQESKILATKLQNQHKKGDTALLLFDTSIDVIIAFWGCVYAGVIPVPVPIPNGVRGLKNILHIVEDANISLVLSHKPVKNRMHKKFQENNQLKTLNWILVEKNEILKANTFKEQIHSSEQILLLQYTSGSTNNPKGVKVSHNNMLLQQEGLKKAFYSDENTVIVSWLPYYHDMGLIGKIIHATFCCGTLILMPPIAFVQKPFRWLKAISKYNGTNSAAPNFAFEDCLRTINDEELKQLNLGSWKVAWNAAEPIQANTLVRFCKKFSKCGFNSNSITTGYGMAEATLAITVADVKSKLKLLAIDENEFKQGNIKVLNRLYVDNTIEQIKQQKKIVVDCGKCIPNHQVKIVNPQNHMVCNNYKVGEVWFNGQSVAKGYWNKKELSQETFSATIQNDNDSQTFLRTGDLGFLDEDENLFIVGRNKDMIIIHGENYAPQDLEFSIFNSHEAFVDNGCVAFSAMFQEEEKVIIVQEIKRTQRKKVDFDKLLLKIKSILSQEFQLQLFSAIFINQANLPKTTSGKVQRNLCKRLFIDKEFDALYTWYPQKLDDNQLLDGNIANLQNNNLSTELSYDKLIQWLENWIKESFPNINNFEKSNNFFSYGMDSKSTALMVYDLENYIGYELDPTLCWNYTNPHKLTNYIISQIKNNQLILYKR